MTGLFNRLRAMFGAGSRTHVSIEQPPLGQGSMQPSATCIAPVAPERRGATSSCGFFELHPLAAPDWGLANTAAFAREGFAGNPVAYRCIMLIARAVAAVPLKHDPEVSRGQQPAPSAPRATSRPGRAGDATATTSSATPHDADITAQAARAAGAALRLLRRPNALQSGRELVEAFIAHLLITGNGWLRVALLDDEPVELHVLDPQRLRIITDDHGWPTAWEYQVQGRAIRLRQQPDEAIAPVMHMRLFSPFSDIEGLSPFAACARAVDIHNAAAAWSKALLDNAARPSGALVYRGEGGALGPEQFQRLKDELHTAYAGAQNAGRPLVLEGGLEWMPLSHSPKDMEHIEMRHAAAREIALAFGVPPMLLGIPGDNTYANYAEANRAFWRTTVLPLARRFAEHFGNWLAPAFDLEDMALAPDVDALEAYAPERATRWQQIRDADFLTINEKRTALGYPPLENGDALNTAGGTG